MKINGKIYHLKKGIKKLLLVILSIILIISTILIIIKAANNLKEEFKKCDETLGYKCSVYDLHNYNLKNN